MIKVGQRVVPLKEDSIIVLAIVIVVDPLAARIGLPVG
jgi:hypothetical protein